MSGWLGVLIGAVEGAALYCAGYVHRGLLIRKYPLAHAEWLRKHSDERRDDV